jgi:hypothetical protein
MSTNAFQIPFRGDEWVRTLALGTLCSILSFLIVPLLLLLGYSIRAIEAGAMGWEELPPFRDWGVLAAKGIVVVQIILIYVVVAAIAGGALSLVSNLLTPLPVFAAGYLLPASLAGYALKGTLSAAFDGRAVWNLVTSWHYLIGFAFAAAVLLVTGILSALLIGALLQFYVLIMLGNYLGQITRKTAIERQHAASNSSATGAAT